MVGHVARQVNANVMWSPPRGHLTSSPHFMMTTQAIMSLCQMQMDGSAELDLGLWLQGHLDPGVVISSRRQLR